MFDYLQIAEPRERCWVGAADLLLGATMAARRLVSPSRTFGDPRRVLILRLERIGDLLMTLPALAALRRRAPQARLDLVVGSWSAPLAGLLEGIDRIEILDVPWLARGDRGRTSRVALAWRALRWRRRRYDLAINFEPDIRSNLLLALSGAQRRVGFVSRGGGPCLTEALSYDPASHTAANTLRLVDAALPPVGTPGADGVAPADGEPRLKLPTAARERASQCLAGLPPAAPLVGIHASGGRAVKQWDPRRFGLVATRLARTQGAAIVLTGETADRPLVDVVRATIPTDVPVVDLCGRLGLVDLAAALERLALFITADTGPMHLAAAVGTPVVAIFGPSDATRWGPLTSRARIVRAAWWCSPCNRIRVPPARCAGRMPDCLAAVDVDEVCHAAETLLAASPRACSENRRWSGTNSGPPAALGAPADSQGR